MFGELKHRQMQLNFMSLKHYVLVCTHDLAQMCEPADSWRVDCTHFALPPVLLLLHCCKLSHGLA